MNRITQIIIIIVGLGLPTLLSAQDTIPLIDPAAELIEQGYHFVLEKNESGKFVYKQFFPSTKQLTHLKTFRRKKLEVLDGPYIEWWDNGAIYYKGQYKKNKRVGEWIVNETRGYPYERGLYAKNVRSGVWQNIDSLDRVMKEHTYVEGVLQGPFAYFNVEGDTTKVGVYDQDTIVFQEILIPDTSGITWDTLNIIEEMPYMAECEDIEDYEERSACSNRVFLKGIYGSIRYPSKARDQGVEGTALIRFAVMEDGTVDQVKVLRGLCDEIATECVQVVNNLPKWNPGIKDGKPIKVYYTLPIKFKL